MFEEKMKQDWCFFHGAMYLYFYHVSQLSSPWWFETFLHLSKVALYHSILNVEGKFFLLGIPCGK